MHQVRKFYANGNLPWISWNHVKSTVINFGPTTFKIAFCGRIVNWFIYLAVPECTNHIDQGINDGEDDDDLKESSYCNINELYGCGENQVCVQLEPENNRGQCQCLQGFDKQDDGVSSSSNIHGARASRPHPNKLFMHIQIMQCHSGLLLSWIEHVIYCSFHVWQ